MKKNSADTRLRLKDIKSKLWHGVAYYPELWRDESIFDEVNEMRKLGINVVRIGEFAWADMEPEPDKIDFSFFEEVMDQLHQLGMPVILGTPTATPPVWLTHEHPERCLHNSTGQAMVHGGRQHLAVDDPYVRERCEKIVSAMAKCFGEHPALLAWQVDNEFKCDTDTDFSPSALREWPIWLEKKYGTVANLNAAWGTGIWSQRYSSFDQVPAPKACPGLHNASLQLSWKDFTRDRIADFLSNQIRCIRAHSRIPITHNTGILFRVDPDRIASQVDFVSFDHYADQANVHRMILNYDFWRNMSDQRRFWVMETSSGHNGSLLGFHDLHPPGFLCAEGVAAYALGGMAFSYWLWRQQRAGAELTHGCLRQSWGTPSVAASEVSQLEQARENLEPILNGAEIAPADTALVWSDRGRMMMEVEPHNGIVYTTELIQWAKRLRDTGLHLDVLSEKGSLENRRLLFTPYMPAISEDFMREAESFVRQGGIWIVGPMTGGRTLEHTVPLDAGLGALDDLGGVKTMHTCPLGGSTIRGKVFGNEIGLSGWGSLLRCREATPVGMVEGVPQEGMAFLTERSLGAGKIVLLTSEVAESEREEFYGKLIRHYSYQARVRDRFPISKGSLVAPWTKGDSTIWICVNIDGKGGEVWLPGPAEDLISGESIHQGYLPLEPFAHRCLGFQETSLGNETSVGESYEMASV